MHVRACRARAPAARHQTTRTPSSYPHNLDSLMSRVCAFRRQLSAFLRVDHRVVIIIIIMYTRAGARKRSRGRRRRRVMQPNNPQCRRRAHAALCYARAPRIHLTEMRLSATAPPSSRFTYLLPFECARGIAFDIFKCVQRVSA